MPCTKVPFDTPEMAKRQLRTWQRKGRRAELDEGHVYKADCSNPGHRNKFHVGRKHDKKRGRPEGTGRQSTRSRIFGEVDDIFNRQFLRITGRFARDDERRRARFVRNDDGPLIQPEAGTLAPGGDVFDVEDR